MTSSPLATSGPEPEQASLLSCHATGFCKEVLAPTVRSLEDRVGDLGACHVDLPGHGASTPWEGPLGWHEAAEAVVALLAPDQAGLLGVGHSYGGAVLARAEILRPGSFQHLLLIEPIILPPPYAPQDIPLAVGAARRRPSFDSREAAKHRFGVGPFANWREDVLDAYVDFGFVDDGDRWVLRCKPDVEAETFRQGSNVDTWDRVGEIDCPVTIVAGSESGTHHDPYLSLLADRFLDVEVVVLDGLGHLAPMEDPEAVGAVLADAIVRRGSVPTID